MELTKKERLKYICRPHYHIHQGKWRVYFNQYACKLYLKGRAPKLKAILTTFPGEVINYRILLLRKQRFIQ